MIERISAATKAPSSARANDGLGASAATEASSYDIWNSVTVQPAPKPVPSAESAVKAETFPFGARMAAEDMAARNMLDSLSREVRLAGSFYVADGQAASQSFFASLYNEA
jgi:hypothetical protein